MRKEIIFIGVRQQALGTWSIHTPRILDLRNCTSLRGQQQMY